MNGNVEFNGTLRVEFGNTLLNEGMTTIELIRYSSRVGEFSRIEVMTSNEQCVETVSQPSNACYFEFHWFVSV